MTELGARLLDAHARDDRRALIDLYTRAAEAAAAETACGFFLTHAHIYALELGDARAAGLRARLIAMGREEPLRDDHTPAAPSRISA